MNIKRAVVVAVFKVLTRVVCRIDAKDLERIPARGPLIVVMNHVNILEIPIIYTQLYPRPVTGFVRSDAWDNRLWGFLLDVCDAIPIRRGEADLGALRRGIDLLQSGYIVIIAPEGTRSHDGHLQGAHAGVVVLAQRSGAPLIPIAYHGSEGFLENVRRLRRTDFHIRVGEMYELEAPEERVNRAARRGMADRVMQSVAALLPPGYRGVYGGEATPGDKGDSSAAA